MVMEMVLILTVVLMATLEGGWRSNLEVILAVFPPLQSSPVAADRLLFWCF
jgi:hypothetical protein